METVVRMFLFSLYSPICRAFLEVVGIPSLMLWEKVFESGFYSERKLLVFSSGSCEFIPQSPGEPGHSGGHSLTSARL